MVVGAVGTGHVGRLLQCVDGSCHQCDREGIRRQHAPPRTAPFHPGSLHAQQDGGREILHGGVGMPTEDREIVVAEVAEMVVLALDQQTAGNEGDADVGHAECRGVRQPVDKGIVGNG